MLKDPKQAIAVDVTWPDGLVSTAVAKEKVQAAPAKDVQPAAPRRSARRPEAEVAREAPASAPGPRRAALAACGQLSAAAPPPRPLTTSTAATPR